MTMIFKNLDLLQEIGGHISKYEKIKYNITSINENKLNKIDNFSPMSMRFCKYQDEMLRLNIDKKNYDIFGESIYGLFCIELSRGEIFCFKNHANIYVNGEFDYFSRSFNFMLSEIYSLRSERDFLKYATNGDILKRLKISSENISNFILEFDLLALKDGNFWTSLLFQMSDCGVPIVRGLHNYIEDDMVVSY